ncbi:hypothetical protein [Paractinoplanes durhamensis]|uniref:Cell division protein FtsK n=1 Tax=Paractinoplanes durhamensis TaxID=113563 RepID=A0ABQ3YZP4_9ACTN|nr:hypothetical protein [Actinoplanes durhamensis]GIE02995.1 hypothetical protein Adu01nite_43450 [Actinoplanes durhamensis]
MTTTAARTSVPSQSQAAGWAVAVVQYGFAVLWVLCGYFALAHAADLTGHWVSPTSDAFIAATEADGGWGWALPVGGVLSLGPMLAGLGLLISALFFLIGQTRGNRRQTIALLGAAAASLLTLVVSLTPAAQALSSWLLD